MGLPFCLTNFKLFSDTYRTIVAPAEDDFRDRGSNCLALALRFAFDQMNDVMQVVKEQGLTVLKQGFDTACALEISVRKNVDNQYVKSC